MSDHIKSQIAAATALAKEQSYEACVEVFKEIFAIHPNQPEAIRALALILLDLGQVDQALGLLADSIDKDHPEPTILYQISTLLKGQSRLDEAADLLVCAISCDPNPGEKVEELKSLLNQLGRLEEFETYFPADHELTDSANEKGTLDIPREDPAH